MNRSARVTPHPNRSTLLALALVLAAACGGGDAVSPDPEPGPGDGAAGILILRALDLGPNESGGGGDALLVTDSTGAGMRHLLIDAGPAGVDGTDLDYVATRLAALGVDTLEALILSHAHSDHFDGMSAVLERTHVRAFYYNGQVRNFFRYTSVIAQAATDAERRVTVDQVVDFDLGTSARTEVRILTPLPTHLADPNAESAEINDGSLGVRVTHGAFTLFVAGDGEGEANLRWRTSFADDTRDVTALKAGHHGANDAVFDNGSFGPSAWLDHTDPALILISANGTSHPRMRALSVMLLRPAEVYCTPVHGDITVRTDTAGTAWTVTPQRNAGTDCMPGRDATT